MLVMAEVLMVMDFAHHDHTYDDTDDRDSSTCIVEYCQSNAVTVFNTIRFTLQMILQVTVSKTICTDYHSASFRTRT